MTRGVRRYLVSSVALVVLIAVTGCSHYMLAEREPWRRDAEVACLNSGAVKELPAAYASRPSTGRACAAWPTRSAYRHSAKAARSVTPTSRCGRQARSPMRPCRSNGRASNPVLCPRCNKAPHRHMARRHPAQRRIASRNTAHPNPFHREQARHFQSIRRDSRNPRMKTSTCRAARPILTTALQVQRRQADQRRLAIRHLHNRRNSAPSNPRRTAASRCHSVRRRRPW